MQQMEIWLVILFLSRNKFHFVVTGFMKLGPHKESIPFKLLVQPNQTQAHSSFENGLWGWYRTK